MDLNDVLKALQKLAIASKALDTASNAIHVAKGAYGVSLPSNALGNIRQTRLHVHDAIASLEEEILLRTSRRPTGGGREEHNE